MTRAALLLALSAACAAKPDRAAPPLADDAPRPGVHDAASDHARDAARSAAPSPVPADATQLLLGLAAGWDATATTLTRFERADGTARWRQVGAPVAAVIGRAGMAWGRGLHGAGAPAGRAGTVKQEGDGRAPAGAFRVLRALGYAAAPPVGATLPYDAVDAAWRCVDDPASTRYNQVLDGAGVAVDWTSAEEMRRDDALYTWVVEIDHNAASSQADAAGPTPGGGSCIFLHVWHDQASTTAGCTAMAQPDLEALLAWLRPGAVYVLLPADEYAALAAGWRLPGG